jgi:putative flippase GtrA
LAKLDRPGLLQLVRFYQAAIVNTVFGFGLYALLVAAGLDPFAAQALAFICGVAFNYLTYSRHVFRDSAPAKFRFVLSYLGVYLLNVTLFAGFRLIIPNVYIAGAAMMLTASLLNYFVLKRIVFRRRGA